MDFDPALLRAFIAVHETGGFTRAAERLRLTQSAISHQIRRLEEQVGRSLLHRTTRRLTLTEDGQDFVRHAELILQANDDLKRRFRSSPVTGVVRFGVPENFMGDRLPQLLRRFSRAFPAVRLEVAVSVCLDVRAKVEAGELDLAVGVAERGAEVGTVLRETRFCWVAAETFELPAGSSLPLALSPAPCAFRAIATEALTASTVDWHVGFTSANQHGLRAAVLAGLAISMVAREDVCAGMKIVDGQYGLPPLPRAAFVLMWRPGERLPCAGELGRLIVEGAEARNGFARVA